MARQWRERAGRGSGGRERAGQWRERAGGAVVSGRGSCEQWRAVANSCEQWRIVVNSGG